MSNYSEKEHEYNESLTNQSIARFGDNITPKNYEGSWYIYNSLYFRGHLVHCLEHSDYGDEAQHLVMDDELNVLCDEIYSYYSLEDLNEELEDKESVVELIEKKPYYFKFLSKELKNDLDVKLAKEKHAFQERKIRL